MSLIRQSEYQHSAGADSQTGSENSFFTDSPRSSMSEHQSHWQGTCIHNYELPRWVQKSRQVDNDGTGNSRPIYVELRLATQVAVNTRFSLVAIGTHR